MLIRYFFHILQNLAAEKSYNNLDVPVSEALKHRAEVCVTFLTLLCLRACIKISEDGINGVIIVVT